MLTCMYTGEPGKRVPLGADAGSAGPSGCVGSEPRLGAAFRLTPVPVSRLGPAGPAPCQTISRSSVNSCVSSQAPLTEPSSFTNQRHLKAALFQERRKSVQAGV